MAYKNMLFNFFKCGDFIDVLLIFLSFFFVVRDLNAGLHACQVGAPWLESLCQHITDL
jgi:hypothetical protein